MWRPRELFQGEVWWYWDDGRGERPKRYFRAPPECRRPAPQIPPVLRVVQRALLGDIDAMIRAADLRRFALVEGFSADDLKAAYRRAVLRTHPDQGGTPEQFIAVQQAYDRLATVDRERVAGVGARARGRGP